MFYASVGAEVTRIGRICSNVNSFVISGRQLVHRALKQGAKCNRLDKTLKKCFGRQQALTIFASNAADFSKKLLDGNP